MQNDNIVVVDQLENITYLNRNAEKMLELCRGEVVNLPLTSLIGDYDKSKLVNHEHLYTRIMKNGQHYGFKIQSQNITIGQEQFKVLLIKDVIVQENSKEKELSDAKKIEFIDTMKNLQNGIFTMRKNTEGKIVYVMAVGKLLEEIGVNDELLRNQTPFEVFPEDIAIIKHIHYEMAFDGNRVNYEIDLNGKRVFVDVIPIKKGNEVGEIVGTVLDISELRSTQKELQLNQEQYKSLLKSSQDYLIVLNNNAQIINMNPKTLDLFSYLDEESSYEKIQNILFGKSEYSMSYYVELALKGNLQNFEFDALGINSTKLYFNVTLLPIMFDNHVQGVYMIGKDITEQKKIQEMNAYLAHHDELTTLPNRRWMEQKLSAVLQQVKCEKDGMLAVLLIDLDRFKSINDTLGHLIGDSLLQEMAKRILASIDTDSHFAARMGGDEFMILCPRVSSEQEVKEIAKRFLQQLIEPFYIEDFELLVTASIGICFYPTGGLDAIDLMKKADIALYKAKDLGRNMFQIYDQSMSRKNYQSFFLERDLRKAIINDEFIVHLQPRVDALTGKTVSAEALIRWMHPDLGLISPGEFIPLAEETGIIIPMGKWMKRKVCEKLVEWREANLPLIPISVNISSQRFLQNDFSREIRNLLAEFQLEGKWLEIEITENSIMKNEEHVFQTLHELKDLGVKIYIDDFGTGYSSFNYLKTFNLDGVKIDRSFIQNISSESENASITTAMIKMAQHLKLEVIAEGVETKEELDYLLQQNCHYIQGYYFGRPCNPEEFEKNFLISN
ncbi:EAL domain-containing protein [Ureibacillus sp. GCM10028918]